MPRLATMSTELAAAFLGAIVGGLVTFVGQWFLGPRVERRVRAQERWEQHVLEAGRLVAQDIPQARERLRDRYQEWLLYAALLADPDREAKLRAQFEEMQRSVQKQARPLHEEWESLVSERLQWLVNRIRPRPENVSYPLEEAVLLYRSRVFLVAPTFWEDIGLDEADRDDPTWGKEREQYRRMADEIENLASSIVPFPMARTQQLWRKVRHRAGTAR